MINRGQARTVRSQTMHNSISNVIESGLIKKSGRIPIRIKNGITRSLIDLKINKHVYDFGPQQLEIIDILIKKSRAAKTQADIEEIHRKTCNLGLDKH